MPSRKHIPWEHAAAALIAALASGCCGGYSVVQTTVIDHADIRPDQPGAVRDGTAFVMHYSRVGEPPNDCGSKASYVEDLYVRVPSLRQGEVFTIDRNGVLASYERSIDGAPTEARSVVGTIAISGREGQDVIATVKITVTLASGETVELDDRYAFHPRSAE
jgi:hypothetical protein